MKQIILKRNIKNKKKIRKLQKYALYNDIQIEFHGVLKYDLEGLPVFSIISYTPPKDNAVAQDEASYAAEGRKASKRKRKPAEDEDETDEELEEDVDFNGDDDFSDDNDDFDADAEFDDSDDESDDDDK